MRDVRENRTRAQGPFTIGDLIKEHRSNSSSLAKNGLYARFLCFSTSILFFHGLSREVMT